MSNAARSSDSSHGRLAELRDRYGVWVIVGVFVLVIVAATAYWLTGPAKTVTPTAVPAASDPFKDAAKSIVNDPGITVKKTVSKSPRPAGPKSQAQKETPSPPKTEKAKRPGQENDSGDPLKFAEPKTRRN